MHPTEINRLQNEIRRLLLAEKDMCLVADAAEVMAESDYVSCRELVQVGMVVAYCRPFSGGPPREPMTEVDALAPTSSLHARLFEVRNKLYAHTDDDYRLRREAVDPFGEHSYSEESAMLIPDLLLPIRDLARENEGRFREERQAREQRLRDEGVPPKPYP